MNDIDKWCAEQCGVVLYTPKQINEHGNYFYFNDVEHDYEWTIQYPRCREIVRERFKIQTSPFEDTCLAVPLNDLKGTCRGYGKTISEAEIACITAIREASDE